MRKISLVLIFSMLFSAVSMLYIAEAATIVASGTCGTVGNAGTSRWKLYDDGSLVISPDGGNADIANYKNEYNYDTGKNYWSIPWYDYREDIKSIEIKNNENFGYEITAIGNNAFRDCSNLTSVVMPDSVKSIGISAFAQCKNLTDIKISSEIEEIGSSAFSNCALESIEIPNGLKFIESSTFYGCNFTSIVIPNEVTVIEGSAFAKCTNLTYIIVPASIERIEQEAFSGCTNLTDVYYAGNQQQLMGVTIGINNSYFTDATIHFESTGPTIEPTVEPTTEPTIEPTVEPTVEPTIEPTVEPTVEPTIEPTIKPTVEPTTEPTVTPNPVDEIVVIGNYSDKVGVEVDVIDEKFVVEMTLLDSILLEDIRLFVAEYDENGVLIDIEIITGKWINGIYTIETKYIQNKKIMLWDKNCSPIIKAITT